MIWDTTPQALREWREERSAQYEDAANASLENPIGASLWGVLSDGLEKAISKTATPESEAPSMSLHVAMEARKKASGRGPPLPGTRQGVWRGPAQAQRASCGTMGNVEIEACPDALQTALFRENTRCGGVGTADRPKAFGAVRLGNEGGTAKGAQALSRKQAKGSYFWRACRSRQG